MDKEFINNPVEAYTRLNSLYNDNCEYTKKLEDTLQEIKTIAERAFAVCDDDCGNANRFTDIIDLLTKAEEE